MADKNVRLQDMQGNSIYPQTLASIVKTTSGGNLGTVEEGAQVNKIEQIKLNGVALSIVNKVVDVVLPGAAEYSIAKAATADSGYSATYYLTKDGTQVGEKINIPKDMVVQSGSVKSVTTADSPVSGYKVGDKYIDLVLANATNSHIYILVSDLIDVYTAGTGITISGNQVSVNTSVIASKSYVDTELAKKAVKADVDTALAGKADAATTLAGYGITDAYTKTQVNTELAKKADKSTTLAGYGIADAYTKTQVDTALDGKADKATTLAGYGITDAITFVELA